jgi:hypothetical protein
MKNFQLIDGAVNATHSIYEVSDPDFERIFPDGGDVCFIGDFVARVGECEASRTLEPLWGNELKPTQAKGIHGTLIYELLQKKLYLSGGKSTDLYRYDTIAYRWIKKRMTAAAGTRAGYFHIQVFDDRPEADYPVFAITQAEFGLMFPNGADMEFEEDFIGRIGWMRGHRILHRIFGRRIPKPLTTGFHGTLFRGDAERKRCFPTKRASEESFYCPLPNPAT